MRSTRGEKGFEPTARRTGVNLVECDVAVHLPILDKADGAHVVSGAALKGSIRLAVHHHYIQDLRKDPHL